MLSKEAGFAFFPALVLIYTGSKSPIRNKIIFFAIMACLAALFLVLWKHFINPDFEKVRSLMRQPVIFDGRNLYRSERMKKAGFTYHSIGRPTV